MEYAVPARCQPRTFPPYVMQAGLIDVLQRFASVRNGAVDASCLPGDDVK